MAYSLKLHHGTYDVLLDGTYVAGCYWDTTDRAWSITACTETFTTREKLPIVFGGRYCHSLRVFGDVLRFFDIPFPGEDFTDVGRAEHALIAAAHRRAADLLARDGEAA